MLYEIVQAAADLQQQQLIFQVLWQLLKEPGKNWRKCYKTLNVIDY